LSLFLRLCDRRQKQRGQDCNNGDHNQQLDQRERAKLLASKLRAEFARAAEIDLSLVHTFFATLLRVYVRPVSRQ